MQTPSRTGTTEGIQFIPSRIKRQLMLVIFCVIYKARVIKSTGSMPVHEAQKFAI